MCPSTAVSPELELGQVPVSLWHLHCPSSEALSPTLLPVSLMSTDFPADICLCNTNMGKCLNVTDSPSHVSDENQALPATLLLLPKKTNWHRYLHFHRLRSSSSYCPQNPWEHRCEFLEILSIEIISVPFLISWSVKKQTNNARHCGFGFSKRRWCGQTQLP